MANLHAEFQKFNSKIRLSDEDRKILMNSRNTLRTRIRVNFQNLDPETRRSIEIFFQSQGSYVMDTIIQPESKDFDLDDGIYLISKQNLKDQITPQNLHDWIILSIDKKNNNEDIEDKTSCVRVLYPDGYHIDLPIYLRQIGYDPELADTKTGWTISNPVEFIEWFERKAESGFRSEYIYDLKNQMQAYKKWSSDMRKGDVQIRRLVRYMKAWGDLKRQEMPCGLILTILIANNYVPHQRDDISFKETLQKILSSLRAKFVCLRPTTPVGENLCESYSHQTFFMNALESLYIDAEAALKEVNYQKASEFWKKHLGERFPLGMNQDDPALEASPLAHLITNNHKPYGK